MPMQIHAKLVRLPTTYVVILDDISGRPPSTYEWRSPSGNGKLSFNDRWFYSTSEREFYVPLDAAHGIVCMNHTPRGNECITLMELIEEFNHQQGV